ncbi:MAG: hypothetical protein WDW36_003240 [Sanguina aurantia]
MAELSLGSKISEGAESVVYLGRWGGQEVAIKKARIGTSADLERFRSELQLMAGFSHPNVLPLLAARSLPPDYLLVLPLMPSTCKSLIYEAAYAPVWQTVLRIARGVASGMVHVHSSGVLHRDLKPANLLLSGSGDVLITDFGIAAAAAAAAGHDMDSLRAHGKPTGGFHKKSMMGTLEYMAPEVLLKDGWSTGSDVYAFGVILCELATGTYPFSDCTKDNPEIHTVLEMGYGRAQPAAAAAAEAPPGISTLLAACWQRDPSLRPSFERVLTQLQRSSEALEAWLQQAPCDTQPAFQAPEVDYSDFPLPAIVDDAADVMGPHAAASASSAGPTPMDSSHPQTSPPSPSPTPAAHSTGYPSWLTRDPSHYRPVLTSGVCSNTGPRDSMEDRNIIAHNLCGSPDLHMMAVFDGHRGAGAADYAEAHLTAVLGACCATADSPTAALKQAFIQLEAGYRDVWQAERDARLLLGRAEASFPGCTAVAALIVGSRLYVANCGDSRAVLCQSYRSLAMSRDHTAALQDERERIVAAGGAVSWQHNGWRIGKSGLQVSRCLGDFDVKGGGVTAEPEVMSMQLTGQDYFLVLATDGLWDVLRNEQAVGLVFDTVKEADMCGKRLVTEALTRGSNDNITALVTFLTPVTTLEKVFSEGKQVHDITPTLYGSRTKAIVEPSYAHALDEVNETY